MAVKPVRTNIRIIGPSRLHPRAGDLFAIRPDELGYLFGRIVDPDTKIGGFRDGGVILIYIYEPVFDTMDPPPAGVLSRHQLLIRPLGINRLPWSRGYFHTVERRPLAPDDVLPRHVFHDTIGRSDRYVDEHGNLVESAESAGSWGLHSFRTVDDEISRALGLPPVPFDD